MKSCILLGVAGACALLYPTVSVAVEYNVTDLGTLSGDASSIAYGINDSGQIVGMSGTVRYDNGYPYSTQFQPYTSGRAFLYDAGSMRALAGPNSYAYAINDSGDVVGSSVFQDGFSGAFLYSGGTMLTIGESEAKAIAGRERGSSEARAINASGQIVGNIIIDYVNAEPSTDRVAFLYSGGTVVDQHSTLGYQSYAYAINAAGQFVGGSNLLGYDAFLYSGGTFHDLGNLGGFRSLAFGINDSGQVVGFSSVGLSMGGGPIHAFLYSGGTMHDLGTLDGILSNSEAYAINNNGQIVGESNWAKSGQGMGMGVYPAEHAFLYSNGTMIDLNTVIDPRSGWQLESATALNNVGQIVGTGINASGQTHAFLLTPVPEPTTIILAAMGVLALRACRRRRLAAS